MAEYQRIGQAIGRLEGTYKVTGKAVYAADMRLPGMLVGKLLCSPLPHARIVNIDTSRAEKLQGVRCVAHGGSFDSPLFGPGIKDQKVFPRERVRYIGEPVAAVAATDEDLAQEALALIRVEYEPLEVVFDPLQALEPDAPILHPDLEQYATVYPNPIKYGNVAMYTRGTLGNVEAGLAKADKVYSHTFKTATTHPAPIEPHVALTQFEGQKATIWATTQQPFFVRAALAEIFGEHLDNIHITVPELGGGFGGKEYMLLEPYCYLLARMSGYPVKMIVTREEEFQFSSPRHASHIELTTGVMNDGTLVARKAHIVYDTGAYGGQGPFVTACGLMSAFSTYRIEHMEGDALCVYTNKPNACSYRGYGFPQAAFASETQIDLIAADLGIDPLELRLKNCVEDGDPVITGQPLRAVGLRQTLEEAAERVNWQERRANRQPGRGIGIACGTKAAGIGASSAVVKVNEDGSATVSCGIVDLGTGSKTVLAQVVAEELGLSIEQVGVHMADTATAPYDFGSVASRAIYCGMNAAKQAAGEAKRKLIELAADQLEIDPADLVLENGFVHVVGQPDIGLPLVALGAISHYVKGGPIVGTGSYIGGAGQSMRADCLEGYPLGVMPHFAYATQIAEVEVDAETGQVTVLRLVGAHDVGKALNPLNVLGQIEGGLVMGMSAGLFEQVIYEDGHVANDSFVDFKLPTAMDVPEIDSIIIEHPEPDGPYGAKGIGEVVSIPTPPAIANAVFDAVGVMVQNLPVTAEKIVALVKESDAARA